MKSTTRKRRRWSRIALILLCLCPTLLVSSNSLSATDPAYQTIDFASVPASLYQAQFEAARSGWTDSLHEEMAALYTTIGNNTAALSHWNALQNVNDMSQRRRVDVYFEFHDWPEYTELLRAMLAQSPEDPWVNYHLGLVLAPINPSQAEALIRRAGLSQEYDLVVSDLLSVLTNGSADPLISFRIGLVLAHHELWDYAEYALNHAYRVGYPYAEAAAYLALVRLEQGKSGDSLMQFALELSPRNSEIHSIHGLYLRRMLEYDASLEAFRLAMGYDPVNPAYAAELGTAYRLVVDLDRAEYWLLRAVQLSGNETEYQQLLATFYSQESTQLIPSEVRVVRDVLQALPNDPSLIAGLGWALYSAGDVDGALTQFDSALAVQPGHAETLYYKARVLAATGDIQAAIPLMEQVSTSGTEYAEPALEYLSNWQD